MPKIHIIKYAKPYTAMIVIAIGLLFAVAYFSLAVPNYLANIVNIGIEQGGVQNAVPQAMNSTEMSHLKLFLSPDEAINVLGNYTLYSANSPQYLKEYPANQNISIYLLNSNVTQDDINTLNNVMGSALLVVSFIDQINQNPSIVTNLSIGLTSAEEEQLASIPQGEMYNFIEVLPLTLRENFTSSITARLSPLGSQAVNTAASAVILSIYMNLGMNTNEYQLNYILGVGLLMPLGHFRSNDLYDFGRLFGIENGNRNVPGYAARYV